MILNYEMEMFLNYNLFNIYFYLIFKFWIEILNRIFSYKVNFELELNRWMISFDNSNDNFKRNLFFKII